MKVHEPQPTKGLSTKLADAMDVPANDITYRDALDARLRGYWRDTNNRCMRQKVKTIVECSASKALKRAYQHLLAPLPLNTPEGKARAFIDEIIKDVVAEISAITGGCYTAPWQLPDAIQLAVCDAIDELITKGF